jgi:hypothetical protein
VRLRVYGEGGGGGYCSHRQAQTAQLEYVGNGHADKVHLAEKNAGGKYDARRRGGGVEQRGPHGAVAASQHEDEDHVLERLVDALPAQEQRGMEQGGGDGGEQDECGVQGESEGEMQGAGVCEALAARHLRHTLSCGGERGGRGGTRKATLEIVFHHSAIEGVTA